MGSGVIQLIVLAGIAVFLILRLRNVLGTREGFEKPPVSMSGNSDAPAKTRPELEVIEGGPDRDITDHVEEGSDAAEALAAMKVAEPGFSVGEFLQGGRMAYEMILMAFEKGDIAELEGLLSVDVYASFEDVIEAREAEGLTIEANFVGVRELTLQNATFDQDTGEGEITMKFVGELTSVVKNRDGQIIEGSPTEIKRQRDVWTFGRKMGADDPNWQLVATGE